MFSCFGIAPSQQPGILCRGLGRILFSSLRFLFNYRHYTFPEDNCQAEKNECLPFAANRGKMEEKKEEKPMLGTIYPSPLGPILLAAGEEGLTGLWFLGQKHFPRELSWEEGRSPGLTQGIGWLEDYFSGEIPQTLPPLAPAGTAFQKRVWQKLLEIPYGQVVTYGALASQLGVKSAQAVGGAVGRNPISLMIPCHRVVGADGTLTGYAGGLSRKQWLLDWERAHCSR